MDGRFDANCRKFSVTDASQKRNGRSPEDLAFGPAPFSLGTGLSLVRLRARLSSLNPGASSVPPQRQEIVPAVSVSLS